MRAMSVQFRLAMVAIAILAVLAVTAASGLATVKGGNYVGLTSEKDQVGQKLNVGLKVYRHKTRVRLTYFEFLNIGCTKVTQLAGDTVKLKSNGKFRLNKPDTPFDSGYVAGKFKGNKASGTAKFPDRCSDKLIRWNAQLSG